MSNRHTVAQILGKWDRTYGERIEGLLEPDEELIAVGPGVFDGRLLGKDASVPGALFVTNHRLIKLTENVIGIEENDSLPLEMISAIDETTLLLGLVEVKITAPDTSFKATGRGLKGVAAQINKARRARKAPPGHNSSAPGNPLEQIEQLGSLLDKGLISQEEFDENKAALLQRLSGRKPIELEAATASQPEDSAMEDGPGEAQSQVLKTVKSQKPQEMAEEPIQGFAKATSSSTPKGVLKGAPLLMRLTVFSVLAFALGLAGSLEGRDSLWVVLLILTLAAGFWSFVGALEKNRGFLGASRASRWAKIPVWLLFVIVVAPILNVAGAAAVPQNDVSPNISAGSSADEQELETAPSVETAEPRESWPELEAQYLAEIAESAPSNFANEQAALNYLAGYCQADLFGDAGETDVVDRIAAKYCRTELSRHLGVEEPSVAVEDIDEEEFTRIAGEKYGVFAETYDDGSSNTPVSMAKYLCENADVSELERNLGDRFESSFQWFALESFCPQKLG